MNSLQLLLCNDFVFSSHSRQPSLRFFISFTLSLTQTCPSPILPIGPLFLLNFHSHPPLRKSTESFLLPRPFVVLHLFLLIFSTRRSSKTILLFSYLLILHQQFYFTWSPIIVVVVVLPYCCLFFAGISENLVLACFISYQSAPSPG